MITVIALIIFGVAWFLFLSGFVTVALRAWWNR